MNWLKRLIFKLNHKRWVKQREMIESQFESIFLQIEKMLLQQNDCRTFVKKDLGKYSFDGGWLRTNFYFDIFKGTRKLGRVYVGYSIPRFEKKIRWHIINRLDVSRIVECETFTRFELALAINHVVPGLISTYTENGQQYVICNITYTDLSSVMELPIQNPKDN